MQDTSLWSQNLEDPKFVDKVTLFTQFYIVLQRDVNTIPQILCCYLKSVTFFAKCLNRFR